MFRRGSTPYRSGQPSGQPSDQPSDRCSDQPFGTPAVGSQRRSGRLAVHHQVVHGPVSERLGPRQNAEPAIAGGLGYPARRPVPGRAADLDERGQRRPAREVADEPDGLGDQTEPARPGMSPVADLATPRVVGVALETDPPEPRLAPGAPSAPGP